MFVYIFIYSEQATIILMPLKISVTLSNNVNPILLRPVPGVVLQ